MTVITKTKSIGKQKSAAEGIIQKGMDNEYRESILSLDRIIEQWKYKRISNSNAYFKLVHNLILSDKNITRRYDNILPEDYASVIASLLIDGFISKEDLQGLNDDMKAEILACIRAKDGLASKNRCF